MLVVIEEFRLMLSCKHDPQPKTGLIHPSWVPVTDPNGPCKEFPLLSPKQLFFCTSTLPSCCARNQAPPPWVKTHLQADPCFICPAALGHHLVRKLFMTHPAHRGV